MWKKGYHQPIQQNSGDDNYNFQPPEVIGTEGTDAVDNGFVTPKHSPNLVHNSNKSFIKTISSISPFHHNSTPPANKSSAAKARSDSPGIHAHSFMESSVIRTASPDRPQLYKTSSQHSNGSNCDVSRSNSTKKTPLSRLSFGNTRKSSSSSKVCHDEDWNTDIDVTPTTPTYPDLSSLSIDEDKKSQNEDYVVVKNPNLPSAANEVKSPLHEGDSNYPFLKKNYQDIVKDPYALLTLPIYATSTAEATKYTKLVKVLTSPTFDTKQLKDIAWKGIPSQLRGLVWQILVNYVSTNGLTRVSLLDRKRKEYAKSISRLYNMDKQERIWHQIHIDVPRTNPSIKLYSFPTTQRSLEKILYLWAIRHPASGYVQGINDLVTPFFQVFTSQYLLDNIDIESFDPKVLPSELINVIEADTFWCLTKVLDTIQDNYIHEQPGIFRQVNELKWLISRDEKGLASHFEKVSIDFIQFAFRWMNCMLMREFRLELIIRMWDTYLAEFPKGFSDFHVYVCCAFLRKFSDVLVDMDFQDIIMFLQDSSKTATWEECDIEMLLSEAYLWEMLYGGTTAHYK